MEATQSVIELVAAAETTSKASELRVAEIEAIIAEKGVSDESAKELNEL